MLKEKTGIGPGLFFALVYAMISGYGLMQAPQLAAIYIGANGYWGVVLAFLLSIPLALALSFLARRFPRRSAIETLPVLLGRPLGKILGGAYLLFILAITVWSLGMVTSHFKLHYLPRTPTTVMVGMILLANLYLVYKGIEVIARLAAFLFPISFLIVAVNIAVSFQSFQWDNVRPALFVEPAALARGTMHMFNVYLPLAAILVFAKYLSRRQGMSRAILSAGGIATAFALLIVLATLGTYGTGMASHITLPYLEIARQSNIPYIQQSFGLFIIVVQFAQYFVCLAGFYFTLAQGSAELFGILDYKRFALALFAPIVILVVSAGGSVRLSAFISYLRPIGFVFLFGLVAVAVTASLLVKRK